MTLGERESGTARLEEAVAAYRDALKERTRERVPLDWAMTQNNLGSALLRLGERESGTARLEEAAASFSNEEYREFRVWAMTMRVEGDIAWHDANRRLSPMRCSTSFWPELKPDVVPLRALEIETVRISV